MNRDRSAGRIVAVAANVLRAEPQSWESRWPAVLLFADGVCTDHVIDAGCHLDDWPSGVGNTVPGPGVWVWEGDMVWTGGQSQDGEEWDVHGEGTWRRPNAAETWQLMRGAAPWLMATPGVR